MRRPAPPFQAVPLTTAKGEVDRTAGNPAGVVRWLRGIWVGDSRLIKTPPPIAHIVFVITLSSMSFGLSLTTHVLTHWNRGYFQQILASVIKVPLLVLTSELITSVVIYACLRFIHRGPSRAAFFHSAVAGGASMALVLGALGPLVVLCSLRGNYTLVILTSYLIFALASASGAAMFCRSLQVLSDATRTPLLRIMLAWLLVFSFTSSQIGWWLRPLVGWTGSPFAWFRNDGLHLYEQAYYEWRNFTHAGGEMFPTTQR
jgi:hypothetical protein